MDGIDWRMDGIDWRMDKYERIVFLMEKSFENKKNKTTSKIQLTVIINNNNKK